MFWDIHHSWRVGWLTTPVIVELVHLFVCLLYKYARVCFFFPFLQNILTWWRLGGGSKCFPRLNFLTWAKRGGVTLPHWIIKIKNNIFSVGGEITNNETRREIKGSYGLYFWLKQQETSPGSVSSSLTSSSSSSYFISFVYKFWHLQMGWSSFRVITSCGVETFFPLDRVKSLSSPNLEGVSNLPR